MKKNESLFSCGKINKYFLIPFLCPIFCFLSKLFLELYVRNENGNNEKFKKKAFLISSITSLSYITGGILYFIFNIRTKAEITKKSSENKIDKEANIKNIFYFIYYIIIFKLFFNKKYILL